MYVWRDVGRRIGQRTEKEVNSKGEGPLEPREEAQNMNKILIQISSILEFLLDHQPCSHTHPIVSGASR